MPAAAAIAETVASSSSVAQAGASGFRGPRDRAQEVVVARGGLHTRHREDAGLGRFGPVRVGNPGRRDQRLARFEADGVLAEIDGQASLEDVKGLVRGMDVERRHLAVGQLALDHDRPAAVHAGSLHRSQRLHQAASRRFEVWLSEPSRGGEV